MMSLSEPSADLATPATGPQAPSALWPALRSTVTHISATLPVQKALPGILKTALKSTSGISVELLSPALLTVWHSTSPTPMAPPTTTASATSPSPTPTALSTCLQANMPTASIGVARVKVNTTISSAYSLLLPATKSLLVSHPWATLLPIASPARFLPPVG